MRVVAVDGTKFDKSGYVTGGSAGNLENAAAAFNAKEEEGLKAERAKLERERQVGGLGGWGCRLGTWCGWGCGWGGCLS